MALQQDIPSQHFLGALHLLAHHIGEHRMLVVAPGSEQHIRRMLELVVEMLPLLEAGRPTQNWLLRRSHKLAPRILSFSSFLPHVQVVQPEVEMRLRRSLAALGSVEHMDLLQDSPGRIPPEVRPCCSVYEGNFVILKLLDRYTLCDDRSKLWIREGEVE